MTKRTKLSRSADSASGGVDKKISSEIRSSTEWKWFGHAAHFICGQDCRFHMATLVGDYLISTVGEYWPGRRVREIHAEVHDPKWFSTNRHLLGDAFDAAYMQKFGYDTIGCDRKYETMVFKAGEVCKSKECGCGLPEIASSELDFSGYNDAGSATQGHMALCWKWASAKYVAKKLKESA